MSTTPAVHTQGRMSRDCGLRLGATARRAATRAAARTRPSPASRRGVTLAELVVGFSTMAILMGALMSAVLVASHALPERDDARDRAGAVADGLDWIERDLMWAVSVTKYSDTEVTFTVADRGHGASGPETVRYAWSGVSGDPVTRQYNGGKETVVVTSAADFGFTWTTEIGRVTNAPRVLLMVANSMGLLPDDAAKKALLEYWGMSVQVTTDVASLAAFQGLVANCDVIYVSEEVNTTNASDLFYETTRGVVIEPSGAIAGYGFAVLPLTASNSTITIADASHAITAAFSTDQAIDITTSNQTLNSNTELLLAPGSQVLARTGSGGALGGVSLAVLDAGAARISGGTTRGRRVAMPWGGALLSNFQFSTLTDSGRTLLRRAITWAAAPIELTRVRVRLTGGGTGDVPVETELRLVNRPRIPE